MLQHKQHCYLNKVLEIYNIKPIKNYLNFFPKTLATVEIVKQRVWSNDVFKTRHMLARGKFMAEI